MKRPIAILSAAAAVGMFAAACAPAVSADDMAASAAESTVAALKADYASTQVTVTDINKTPVSSAWSAQTPNGAFDCTGNERFQLAVCLPSETNVASN